MSKVEGAARIDVVVPAFNAERFIEQALQSIVCQGDCVASIIVVDDGSTDATVQVVERFSALHANVPIHCLAQMNAGPSAARNRGLAFAKAEFVALLDADDVWMPGKLCRQLALFDASSWPDLGVVYCDYGLITAEGEQIENRGFRLDPTVRGQIGERLLSANLIAGSASAVLIRRDFLERVGTFDERLMCAEDWDLWLRLAQVCSFDYVKEELVNLRLHPNNAQKNETRMLGGELLFLNKLFERRQIRWFHLARLWRRLALFGHDARGLAGFDTCHPYVKWLFSGWRNYVFSALVGNYLYVSAVVRRFIKTRLRVF